MRRRRVLPCSDASSSPAAATTPGSFASSLDLRDRPTSVPWESSASDADVIAAWKARVAADPADALAPARPGDGLYYHVSSRNNQLSEWVSVTTVLSELAAFFAKVKRKGSKDRGGRGGRKGSRDRGGRGGRRKGSKDKGGRGGRASVFILNASDLKPYLLSLSAAMAFAFSPEAAGPDASSFIQRWSAQHFGAAAGTSVAVAYEGYAAVADTAMSDYGLVIAIQNLADAMLSKAVVGDFNFTSLRPGAGAILNASSATVSKWQSLSRKSAAMLPTLPKVCLFQSIFSLHSVYIQCEGESLN